MKNVNATIFKKSIIALSVAALASTSLSAVAEQKSGVTISPMVGHMVYGGKTNLDDSMTLSLAAGYQFANPWAVELAYLKSDADESDSANEFSLEQLRLDTLYHFASDTKFTPYAVFGVGQASIEDDDEAMVNAGLGLKYAYNEMLSVRSDVRAIRVDNAGSTDMAFNIGLHFLLGGSSAPVKASKPAPVVDMDSDNDGVVDRLDACLGTAAGVSVDSKGCAINMDVDGDGVVNSKDECPDTRAGAKVDEKGCYVVLEEDITVALNVNFANNSDQIVAGAEQIEEIAEFMKQYPFTKVVVEGYTDSRGSEAYNLSLSQKRADAIAARLVQDYSVDASRVSAKGYGEANPVATNETAEGRAANRRVSAVVSATVEKIAE